MNLNVVFTGPAVSPSGETITRDVLKQACELAGIVVQNSIRADTNLLVASRADTVKAKNAELRGVEVMTYQTFINIFMRDHHIPTGGEANPYTDVMGTNSPKTYKKYVAGTDLAAIDIL